jgi:hypothetical protein
LTTFPGSTIRCPARPSIGDLIVQYSRLSFAVRTAASPGLHLGLGDRDRVLPLVEVLLADRPRLHQPLDPLELLLGQVERRLLLGHVRLGLGDGRLERAGVDR